MQAESIHADAQGHGFNYAESQPLTQELPRLKPSATATSPAGLKPGASTRRRDRGAMLLAVLFMIAIMVIVALAVAPSMVMQIKRDREEEMIHRGTEYARAIKKYYKKFGRYPANLEQLDNTNQIRFLRRRFKDPLTKDGQWKLLNYGDIASLVGVGTPAAQLAALTAAGGTVQNGNLVSGTAGNNQTANAGQGATGSLTQQPDGSFGTQTPGGAQAGITTSSGNGGTSGATGQSGFSLGPGPGQNSGAGGTQGQGANSTGQTGSNNTIFGNTGVGGQTFGGGAIVGVGSKSKDPTIRIFNKKKTYDEWQFIYSPMMDTQTNSLLRGPYNGQTLGNAQQIGTPAGQLNQGQPGQQPGVNGQQPGGFGQQSPQQNQQPNQQLTPGGQFPPDQSQPQ
jgi:type II secretory pathway pseudopilin PulG